MQSHILLLVLFAFLVSLVFAALSKDDLGAQVQFGARLFGIMSATRASAARNPCETRIFEEQTRRRRSSLTRSAA